MTRVCMDGFGSKDGKYLGSLAAALLAVDAPEEAAFPSGGAGLAAAATLIAAAPGDHKVVWW